MQRREFSRSIFYGAILIASGGSLFVETNFFEGVDTLEFRSILYAKEKNKKNEKVKARTLEDLDEFRLDFMAIDVAQKYRTMVDKSQVIAKAGDMDSKDISDKLWSLKNLKQSYNEILKLDKVEAYKDYDKMLV